ncbi:unnamed protein product [Aphanomyces euteiches]|uniref:Uncharacterized protein n=1 Tax=Aphanomyces euteiches TaxID=100861 RepID=A0A6G0XKB0_9STRA|nr:hypothetical protein Ae201684_003998 [Aphanomyces euteiches]KAH9084706.1 hypothetical protein Ae201684P_001946 [Aphanomyces euteiches]
MQDPDATPKLKPRHLSFLSPDEKRSVFVLSTLLNQDDYNRGSPKETPRSNQEDEEEDDDEGVDEESDYCVTPEGLTSKRRKHSFDRTNRIVSHVFILKQPPDAWEWRQDKPSLRFDLLVGLVSTHSRWPLLPIDSDKGAFHLWLMTEDGNGASDVFKLQWTRDPSVHDDMDILHVELATTRRPSDDEVVRVHVKYTGSDGYNAFPTDSNDIRIRVLPFFGTPLSPILPKSPSSATLKRASTPPPDLSFNLISTSLSFSLLDDLPPADLDTAAFEAMSKDRLVKWAFAAASVLRKVEACPVPGTFLNRCAMCDQQGSLDKPLRHSEACRIHGLLEQADSTKSPWTLEASTSEDYRQDDPFLEHSLVRFSPTPPADANHDLSQSLSSLQLNNSISQDVDVAKGG